MVDRFSGASADIKSAAIGAYVITPSNSVDLTEPVRQITIGGNEGAIAYIGWDGVTYTTNILPIGNYPIFARRVLATGTTATGLTGWV